MALLTEERLPHRPLVEIILLPSYDMVCHATMPVRIENLEEMSEEEFERLRRARSGRAVDPTVEELLVDVREGVCNAL